jgi:hypothetical protein
VLKTSDTIASVGEIWTHELGSLPYVKRQGFCGGDSIRSEATSSIRPEATTVVAQSQ